jgi:Ala-tRNA(Pro) deacylase
VAKSVLLALGDQYILAVLPATHRIELERLRALFNTTELRLATEDDLERVFYDCERGAVPALGSLYGLTTLIDSSLAGSAEIIFDGNARHESVKVRFRDFESLEKPRRERFAAWVTPPRTRRAG